MAGTTAGSSARHGGQRSSARVITDARLSTSDEMAGRVKRYTITMAFRTACFIAMIFVPGTFRWILFACAVFLPYLAVIFANQAHTRDRSARLPTPAPPDAAQLTSGPPEPDVISGDADADSATPFSRADRNDRVA